MYQVMINDDSFKKLSNEDLEKGVGVFSKTDPQTISRLAMVAEEYNLALHQDSKNKGVLKTFTKAEKAWLDNVSLVPEGSYYNHEKNVRDFHVTVPVHTMIDKMLIDPAYSSKMKKTLQKMEKENIVSEKPEIKVSQQINTELPYKKEDKFSNDMTSTFIDAVRQGKAPWQNELNVDGKTPIKDFGAFNPVSGAKYKGFNLIYLKTKQAEMDSQDPRWVTSKHCESVGWEKLSDKKSKTCVTYYDTKTGNYQYNAVYNGKEISNITPLNPDLIVTLTKNKDHEKPVHYVAKDNSTKELLVEEISKYMAASATGTEFKPNKALSADKTVDYFKNSLPTEMFYLSNKAYSGTKEKTVEKEESKEIEKKTSLEKPGMER